MQNITIGRYTHPETHGFAGWIEPDDKSWIAFIGTDGAPRVYLDRGPDGAVIDRAQSHDE